MLQFETPSLSRGVRNILIVTTAAYAVQIMPFIGESVTDWCLLMPSRAIGNMEIWRLFTYMFLHDPRGPWHLVFNMLALWMCGTEIETLWGTRRFVFFYLYSGIAAGLFSFFLWNSPIIGASGAVLAILTVYAFYYPQRRVLMFFIFPMPVWIAVIIIGFISIAGSLSSAGGISHITHLGGILAALAWVKGKPLIERISWIFGKFVRRREIQKAKTAMMEKQRRDEMVDSVLKKISKSGMGSLSQSEKDILLRASRK
jgi:membrane associated rhomboid family serine protease